MKNIVFLAIVFLSFSLMQAQKGNFTYSPKSKDSLINYINKINEKKKSKFTTRYKKEIAEIIATRKDEFIKSINDSTYVFDDRIAAFVNNVVARIYEQNRSFNRKDQYFFINKSPIPNAACYGNGIFSINLGLFNLVENDDEFAFIICHEISHYILEHNDKSLLSYVETYNSKDFKDKMSKVKKIEFGKRQAFAELSKSLKYNFLNRSRTAEFEADSMAIVLLSKTKYKKEVAIDALKRLEFVDDMIFNVDVKLKDHFNFISYPFKDAWLSKEETLFDLKESANDYKLDQDSIKTHPDIKFRIEKIGKLIKTDNERFVVSEELKKIKNIVSENSITVFVDDGKFDFAIYQILLLFNAKQIDQESYATLLSTILKRTYELKENHSFGKYVSPVNAFSDEKYLNEIRLFLNNIELKNLKKIGLQFCLKHETLMNNNQEFIKNMEFFKKRNL